VRQLQLPGGYRHVPGAGDQSERVAAHARVIDHSTTISEIPNPYKPEPKGVSRKAAKDAKVIFTFWTIKGALQWK
jgi:hypothetical protein